MPKKKPSQSTNGNPAEPTEPTVASAAETGQDTTPLAASNTSQKTAGRPDFNAFWNGLQTVAEDTLNSFTNASKAMAKEMEDFLAQIAPEIQQNYETASRLGDQTHWDTLEIEAARVVLQGVRSLGSFSASQRQQIRDSLMAIVKFVVALGVAA